MKEKEGPGKNSFLPCPGLWRRLSFVDVDVARRIDVVFGREQWREQVGGVDIEEMGQASGIFGDTRGRKQGHLAQGADTGLLQHPARAPTPGSGCGCRKVHWESMKFIRPICNWLPVLRSHSLVVEDSGNLQSCRLWRKMTPSSTRLSITSTGHHHLMVAKEACMPSVISFFAKQQRWVDLCEAAGHGMRVS